MTIIPGMYVKTAHLRNHALIAPGRSWQLSPAYDLTPSPLVSQERRDLALQCGDRGRWANASNLLSQHGRFLLTRSEAEDLVRAMQQQVAATWYQTARVCGVSEADIRVIHGAFDYPGFTIA